MNAHRCHPAAWLGAALVALSSAAQAAPAAKPVDPLRLHYERERADCLTGKSQQPRNVCLREASSAYALARQGKLVTQGDNSAQWAANALKRCDAQQGDERLLCERRVREGEVMGSVEAGGQSKTLTIRSTDIPKSPGG